jgi:hypothetical protein
MPIIFSDVNRPTKALTAFPAGTSRCGLNAQNVTKTV